MNITYYFICRWNEFTRIIALAYKYVSGCMKNDTGLLQISLEKVINQFLLESSRIEKSMITLRKLILVLFDSNAGVIKRITRIHTAVSELEIYGESCRQNHTNFKSNENENHHFFYSFDTRREPTTKLVFKQISHTTEFLFFTFAVNRYIWIMEKWTEVSSKQRTDSLLY